MKIKNSTKNQNAILPKYRNIGFISISSAKFVLIKDQNVVLLI